MTNNYLRLVLRAMLVFLWVPAIACAATITLQTTLDEITWPVAMLVAFLSTLSGATALVVRIDRELRAQASPEPLRWPWLFTGAHMMGSWLAGASAFIVAEGQNLNDWLELGMIVAFSFVGAKAIEKLAESFLGRASTLIGDTTKN